MNLREQQAIYEEMLNTAKKTSEILKSAVHNIEQAIDKFIKFQYEKNQNIYKQDITKAMDPNIAPNIQDPSYKTAIDRLQKIQNDLAKKDEEVMRLETKLAMIKDDMTSDVKLKENHPLTTLNKELTKSLSQLEMLSGVDKLFSNLTSDKKEEALNKLEATCGEVYEKVLKLKTQAKEQKKVAAAPEPTTPKFGKTR